MSAANPLGEMSALRRELVIATDLDGALLAGSDGERHRFYEWIARRRRTVGLVFATGRALENVAALLGDAGIPSPDFVIGDAGASVAAGPDLERLEPIERILRRGWPGRDAVRDALRGVEGMREQAVPQSGRVAYVLDRVGLIPGAARSIAGELGVNLVVAGVYLDVLPPYASKGAALRALLERAGASIERALVCSHTLNDLSMYDTGARGVVVGAADSGLLSATRDNERVYHARSDGAGGIREAIAHFFGAHVL